jgi:hypothetical protein
MVKEKYRNSVSGYSDMENAIPAMYEKIERLGSHEKSVGPLALLLLEPSTQYEKKNYIVDSKNLLQHTFPALITPLRPSVNEVSAQRTDVGDTLSKRIEWSRISESRAQALENSLSISLSLPLSRMRAPIPASTQLSPSHELPENTR